MGRPRHIWEDNIRMDLEEISINAGSWVDSAQDRNYWRALVNAAFNPRVPQAMELDSRIILEYVWTVVFNSYMGVIISVQGCPPVHLTVNRIILSALKV